MITFETVTQTWQRMSQTPMHEAPEIVNQMQAEQPVVLSYLIHLEDLPFNQHERELIFYLGMVVWQIMKQSEHQLYKVTGKKLRKAEDANVELLEQLESYSEGELIEAIQLLLADYPEPEILRYVVEAIMEESQDDPGFRDEYRGLAFVHLKILLDSFISSLARRPDLVA